MCYNPNVMIAQKFMGGIKRLKNEFKWTDAQIEADIKEERIKLIPCGQCLECRLNYARNWAARCEVESYYHKSNYFITLTYSDENLPILNKITGEIYRGLKDPVDYYKYQKHYEVATLIKSDMQKFLKRLRKQAEAYNLVEDKEQGIRYFLCGEYGSKNKRPHYHAIIYGLALQDLKYKYSKNGHQHFTSKWLEKVWGMGLVDIGGVDYESCQYVAQYVVKKQKGKGAREWYQKNGLAPEYVNMSLKPGIGIKYYEEHREEIYSKDMIYLKKGRTQKPPKAYDLKEDAKCLAEEMQQKEEEQKIEDEEEKPLIKVESTKMRELKRERRQKATEALIAKLKKTSLGITSYMDIRKTKYEQQHSIKLKRDACDSI